MDKVERYRHAVAEKSRAEKYRRTAVQYMDTYYAHYKLEYWKKEMEDAYQALQDEN
jgi:hypothetical protein